MRRCLAPTGAKASNVRGVRLPGKPHACSRRAGGNSRGARTKKIKCWGKRSARQANRRPRTGRAAAARVEAPGWLEATLDLNRLPRWMASWRSVGARSLSLGNGVNF